MNKGFTLVELMVVVLIIGILTAIAIPEYTRGLEKARGAEAALNVNGILEADRLWMDEFGYSVGYQNWREIYYIPDTVSDCDRTCQTKYFSYALSEGMHEGSISGGALTLATVTRLGNDTYTLTLARTAAGTHTVTCAPKAGSDNASEMCESFNKNQGWSIGN